MQSLWRQTRTFPWNIVRIQPWLPQVELHFMIKWLIIWARLRRWSKGNLTSIRSIFKLDLGNPKNWELRARADPSSGPDAQKFLKGKFMSKRLLVMIHCSCLAATFESVAYSFKTQFWSIYLIKLINWIGFDLLMIWICWLTIRMLHSMCTYHQILYPF